MHQDSNFGILYDAIGKRMKEGPGTSALKAEEEAKAKDGAADTADHVTARNESIGIGKIHIGGDVSGNIMIGNNQVNNKK
jgi:hypothetical protein